MFTAMLSRNQFITRSLSVLLIAMLLSACGRIVQSAPEVDPTTSVSTPALAGATVQTATITLDGVIQEMAQERWRVGGAPILLDLQTTISGTPTLGDSVHILGVLTDDGAVRAQTITANALPQPTPAGASPTVAPSALPTSTPLPQGTVVTINGVIQQVNITNNSTTIVVNNISYVVPTNVVVILGKHLRIGVPVVFVGRVDVGGQITIVNVTHIDNNVIVINPPGHEHENEDDQGDD